MVKTKRSKGTSCCSAQPQLPSALQLHIVSLLPPNDRALSARLAFRDLRADLSKPEHCTAHLSQPLPPHAAPWAVAAGMQHVRQLRFRHKLQLLSTAAASGSEVNLEVALQLLQPSIFPNALSRKSGATAYRSPSDAAVEAGHVQLLGWLQRRCPGLLRPEDTLVAAAKHCHLDGLKAAYEALNSLDFVPDYQGMLDAAAESTTPDAVAKVEWVLSTEPDLCLLQLSTAAAAARSGDLARLQYLYRRGCNMVENPFEENPERWPCLLSSALQHADLAMVQWLVDEAGCELPDADGDDWNADDDDWSADGDDWSDSQWRKMAEAAARGPGAAAKLRWLQERGAPSLDGGSWSRLAGLGIEAGRVEVLEHLLSTVGPGGVSKDAPTLAASAGNVAALGLLHKAGFQFTSEAYKAAAGCGKVAAVRWLAREAGVSAAGLELLAVVSSWPSVAPKDSRDLLEAVQVLVGEAGCREWDTEGVVQAAARRGDLALVQYLLQQPGCQLPDWSMFVAAAETGCEALLEWLAAEHPSCLVIHRGVSPYVKPAVCGDRATLTALRRLGVPWGTEGLVAEVVNGSAVLYRCSEEGVLRWLVEQGAPVGSKEDVEGALSGAWGGLNADAMAWLRGLVAGGSPAAGR